MKISVAVIAHNEELWIERCITSILLQTKKPDEIIILLHNCTDRTKELAEKFPVRIVECFEHGNAIISRARSIEVCTGDIVCCTDGDAWVDKNWVKNLTSPLVINKNISIVGGYTKIINNLFWKFSCWWQFVINRKVFRNRGHLFAWGSNFAFRKKDYEAVGGLLPFLKIHRDLNLNYPAEDLYLSLALRNVGTIFFATNAVAYTYMPSEKVSIQAQKIIVPKQQEDNRKLFGLFKI